jgi:glutathione S-transferase
MLQLETTATCGQTPRVLMTCEELGIEIELVVREEGHFLRTHHQPGPRLHDGALTLFFSNAINRYLCRAHGGGRLLPTSHAELARMEAWMDFSIIGLGIQLGRMMQEMSAPPERRDAERLATAKKSVDDALIVLEEGLGDREWLLDEFSLADCSLATMGRLKGSSFPLPANVAGYLERLTARPSYARMQARLQR